MTDFPTLLTRLVDAGVRFILVGGLAGTVHGSARLTQGIDVVYDRLGDNIDRLVAALAELHPYLRGAPPGLPFDWTSEAVRRGLNFTLTTSAGALNVLGEIPGGPCFADPVDHTIVVDLFGKSCRCLDLPTLIRTKRAAGRPKDLEAIAELEALREEQGEGGSCRSAPGQSPARYAPTAGATPGAAGLYVASTRVERTRGCDAERWESSSSAPNRNFQREAPRRRIRHPRPPIVRPARVALLLQQRPHVALRRPPALGTRVAFTPSTAGGCLTHPNPEDACNLIQSVDGPC